MFQLAAIHDAEPKLHIILSDLPYSGGFCQSPTYLLLLSFCFRHFDTYVQQWWLWYSYYLQFWVLSHFKFSILLLLFVLFVASRFCFIILSATMHFKFLLFILCTVFDCKLSLSVNTEIISKNDLLYFRNTFADKLNAWIITQ